MTKLLKKHNANIRRTTTKYKHTHTSFVETFNKELEKQLFKSMDARERQEIWIKNLRSIVNKMNNTKLSMIGMKSKDVIKLDIARLDKTCPGKNVLPEDGL